MRNKPSTNEFYRSVLDNALREQWVIQKPDVHHAKQERSRRLSSLYGYNMSSSMIRKRMNGEKGGSSQPRMRSSEMFGKQSEKSGPRRMTLSKTRSTGRLSSFREEDVDKMWSQQQPQQQRQSHLSVLVGSTVSLKYQPSLGLLGEGVEKEDVEEKVNKLRIKQRRCTRKSIAAKQSTELGMSVTASSAKLAKYEVASSGYQEVQERNEAASNTNSGPNLPHRLQLREQKRRRHRRHQHRLQQDLSQPQVGGSQQPFDLRMESKMKRTRINIDQPWYFGRQNSVKVPSHTTTTTRYGYKGTLNMMRMEKGLENKSVDYGITNLTFKHSLPRFKGEDKIVDEYVELVEGPPRAWPQATQYVTGSSLKGLDPVPEIPERARRTLQRISKQLAEFNEEVVRERVANQTNAVPWRDSVVDICPSNLRPREEKNRLIQEGKRMRYWPGMTAMCARVDDDIGLTVALQRERDSQERMYELKWIESMYLCKLLRSLSIQLKPDLDEFKALLMELRTAVSVPHSIAIGEDGTSIDTVEEEEGLTGDGTESANGDASTASGKTVDESSSQHLSSDNVYITRNVFINVLGRHFEHADRRRLNKLYSGFDPHRMDSVDYRVVMAVQRCFWNCSETIVERVFELFAIMDQHRGDGVLSFKEVESLFSVCAIFEDDHERVQQLLKLTRPFFMSYTLYSEPEFISKEEFQHMLNSGGGGTAEHHPLVIEFAAQLDRRLNALKFMSKMREPGSPQDVVITASGAAAARASRRMSCMIRPTLIHDLLS